MTGGEIGSDQDGRPGGAAQQRQGQTAVETAEHEPAQRQQRVARSVVQDQEQRAELEQLTGEGETSAAQPDRPVRDEGDDARHGGHPHDREVPTLDELGRHQHSAEHGQRKEQDPHREQRRPATSVGPHSGVDVEEGRERHPVEPVAACIGRWDRLRELRALPSSGRLRRNPRGLIVVSRIRARAPASPRPPAPPIPLNPRAARPPFRPTPSVGSPPAPQFPLCNTIATRRNGSAPEPQLVCPFSGQGRICRLRRA